MNKQEFISHKIAILINEGKKPDQAAAIAYSMWSNGDHKQEGGSTVYNPLNEDYFKKVQDYLANFTPALQPMPVQQMGGYYINNPTGFQTNYGVPTVPNNGEFNATQNQNFNSIGYNPSIPQSLNTSPQQSVSEQFASNNPLPFQNTNEFQNGVGYTPNAAQYANQNLANTPATEGVTETQNQDWIKYNILNPYNQGMDLTSSLTYTGQQFGQGKTGQGIMGAGLSLLKGARSFLSGYASGKSQQDLEKQMRDKLYNNDSNLYTRTDTYQEGGETTNADLMTGAVISEVPLQQPNNPEFMPYYNQLLDRKIVGYKFNEDTQQYEVEYE